MDDFGALVRSLGENVLDYVGRDHVAELTVVYDQLTAFASVVITLRDPSWAEQRRAISKMVEIRELFLDDVAIDYSFDDLTPGAERGRRPAVSYAAV